MNYFQFVLQALLQRNGQGRWDTSYTAALERDLEFVKSQTYDVKYPEIKFRKFIPIDNSVDPGAESIAYKQWDEVGMAKIISNYADDLPMVDALGEKFTSPIHSVGDAYQYSIQDLRRSAFGNEQLDARRARSARRFVERIQDQIAAFGDSKSKLKGLLNHPNVPVYTATSDGSYTYWVAGRGSSAPKAPLLILRDIADVAQSIVTLTKETQAADTLLLPTRELGHLSVTPMSTDNTVSILRVLLANSQYIKNVDSWNKLATANAAGTGPRAVIYQRDPDVLEYVIPQEFEQLPPQARNLAFVVPCHARTGGLKVYYPLGIAYLDGIGPAV